MTSRACGATMRRGVFAVAIASLFPPWPVLAAGVGPGEEFRVSDPTDGNQGSPAVAHSASGDFVVTWADYSEEHPGIYARRYRANGRARDRQVLRVDTPDEFSSTPPLAPDVAMDPAGDFVVSWLDLDTRAGRKDGTYYSSTIFARRFAPSGRARDEVARTIARSDTYRTLGAPSVAMDAVGNFVVVFDQVDFGAPQFSKSCFGAFAARRAANGRKLSTLPLGNEDCSFNPTVAMEPDGDFVVAYAVAQYNRRTGDFVSARLLANRYDAAGVARDATPAVVAPAVLFSRTGDVAVQDDGDFIVTWSSSDDGYPVSRSNILARRFSGGGVLRGAPIQVNATDGGPDSDPRVGIAADGSFTVVWQRDALDRDGQDIYRRSYNPRGRPVAPDDVRVNVSTLDVQNHAAVSVNASGHFVVAWESAGGQDGDGSGVYAQLEDPPSTPVPPSNQRNTP